MEVPGSITDNYVFGQCMNMFCDELRCTFFASCQRNPRRCMNCCCMDWEHEMLWQKRDGRWLCTATKRNPPPHFSLPSSPAPRLPAPTNSENTLRTSAILRRYSMATTPVHTSVSSAAAAAVPQSTATAVDNSESSDDEMFAEVDHCANKRKAWQD